MRQCASMLVRSKSAPTPLWRSEPPVPLEELIGRPWWHELAACRGQDQAVFFPERGESTAAAKAVCAGCPVVGECRSFAESQVPRVVGVWAGLSTEEWRRGKSRPAA